MFNTTCELVLVCIGIEFKVGCREIFQVSRYLRMLANNGWYARSVFPSPNYPHACGIGFSGGCCGCGRIGAVS